LRISDDLRDGKWTGTGIQLEDVLTKAKIDLMHDA